MKTRLLDRIAIGEQFPAERPRGIAPAPLRPGHAHAAEVLRGLKPRPFPGLMASCGATHAACVLADAILDDLSDLAEDIVDLTGPLEAAMTDHTNRTLLMPWLARITELLTTGTPAEPQPAPIPDGWDRPVTPEEHAAAAQRKATVASWTAQTVGDPKRMPDYLVRQQQQAARIFAGLETADKSTPIAADAYQSPANPDRTRRRRSDAAKTYTETQCKGENR